MSVKITKNFLLREFMPANHKTAVPGYVLENLTVLCEDLLQPLRDWIGLPVIIHSGWRPDDVNAAAGGVPTSDHQRGNAADFHVAGGVSPPAFGNRNPRDWQTATYAAFRWLAREKQGLYGQLIIEDRRIALSDPGKLWIHAANRTPKHPGTGDPNRLLASYAPKNYEPTSWDAEPPLA